MKVNREPPSTATPPTTPRGLRRREALLEAAGRMFLERGYERASIEELIQQVGGSKASLYRYFGSKEKLFEDVVFAQIAAFLRNLMIPEGIDPAIEKSLKAIGMRYQQMLMATGGHSLIRLVMSEAQRFPRLAERFADIAHDQILQTLGAYLRIQADAGLLDCPEPERDAGIFMELMRGPLFLRSLLGLRTYTDGDSPEAHVNRAVHVFLRGCGRAAKTRGA